MRVSRPRNSSRWSLGLAIIVLVALGLAALPPAAARAAAPVVEVTGGTLSWGVKTSFRSYITGPIAHGSIEVSNSATQDGGKFGFEVVSGKWTGAVSANGKVRFTGHDGELDVTVANPRLDADGASAKLVVDAVDSEGKIYADLAIATVDLSGAVSQTEEAVTVTSAPAVLTAAGSAVFSYAGTPMYPAGTELDPVSGRFTLAKAAPSPEPEPTTASPEPTPSAPEPTDPTPAPTSAAPSSPVASEAKVVDGAVTWGLKSSFRSYLTGPIAHGSITAAAPATDDGSNTRFPAVDGAFGKSVSVRTGGGVRFIGHGGDLDVRLTDVRIVGDWQTAALVVDAIASDGTSYDDLALASLALAGRVTTSGDQVTIAAAPATLTKAGAAVFNYAGTPMYPEGTVLDPVSAALRVSGVAPTPTSTASPSASTSVAPSPSAAAATAVEAKAKAGSLSWGVKSSFRSYVLGPIANGSIAVSRGASAASGGYRFGQSATTAAPPSAVGTTSYRGTVRFRGHHGTLNLAFSDPIVTVRSANTASLSVSVSGRGRVVIAQLVLGRGTRSTASGSVAYRSVPATLTAAGAKLFTYSGESFYAPGIALDPVSFVIGGKATGGDGESVVGTAAKKWTAPASPPAKTGLSMAGDEVTAGGEVTATASGFKPAETGIRVVLYSKPVVLATDVEADAAGVATWTGRLPAALAAGDHTLTFQGSVDRGAPLTVAEPKPTAGCQVTGAALKWGFKESFRAYVSGSIANGDWTTSDGAEYRTPEFGWPTGSGAVDPAAGSGELAFKGAITFTGHKGALNTRIADPVVRFVHAESAVLELDYSGTTMDAAMAGSAEVDRADDVPFVELDLVAGRTSRDGDQVTITDIPTRLTAQGSAAFPNYEAGTAFDKLTVSYQLSADCAAAAVPPSAVPSASGSPVNAGGSAPSAAAPDAAANPIGGWLPWAGGGLLGLVVGSVGTLLAVRVRGARS